jgi:hypothetical protein
VRHKEGQGPEVFEACLFLFGGVDKGFQGNSVLEHLSVKGSSSDPQSLRGFGFV